MNEELIFFDTMEYTLHWINENYNKEMSVNQISQRLYISPATFSRKFQKLTQKTFTDYVNELRISHAKEDLANTNKNITDIALQHGFGNVSVFSKIFKHYEDITPSKYRKEHSNIAIQAPSSQDLLNISLSPSTNLATPFSKVWNFALDLGDAEHLLHAKVQNHVLKVKQELGIRYIRMCNVFSEAILTRPTFAHISINFEKLDAIIDFLVSNGLKPWMDLEKGAEPFAQNISNAVRHKQPNGIMEIEDNFTFLEKLLIHWNARYGTDEVSSWNFEIWFKESEINETDITNYIHSFSHFYSIIKSYAPKAKLGAMGKAVPTFMSTIEKVLSQWPSSLNQPDFLSIFCFPYEFPRPDSRPNRSQKVGFTQDHLGYIQQILKNCHMEDIPVYITEWNTTIYERNAVNDSCIRAGFMLQNIADTVTFTQPIICHSLSDITCPTKNDHSVLYGGSGLLSRHGIPKPAYQVLSFMKNMSDYILAKGDGYIITTDRRKRFDVLLFNALPLPDSYYEKQEYEITDDIVLSSLITGLPDKQFSINIDTASHPRAYQVRKQRITPGVNDLQGVLKDFGSYHELDGEDLMYIKSMSQPNRTMSIIETPESSLHIDCRVKPYEIVYMTFFPM